MAGVCVTFIYGNRRSQGGLRAMPPHIFRTYDHFVHWEAVYQTNQCYSPKIKHFPSPKFLGWLRYWPLLLKMKSDCRSRSVISQKFDWSGAGSERKTQDPAGVDSGSVATTSVGFCGTLISWVIGFVFSITGHRSASASVVAFFRLLEPLSYVRFGILKLKKLTVRLTLLTKLRSSCRNWSH